MSNKGVFIRWHEYQDKSTTLSEKFIYKEIESLSILKLGCIAKNEHFASIMGIEETAVSRLINSLKKKGFITVKIKNGSRNHARKITLNKLLTDPKQFVNEPLTNCQETKGNKSINKPIKKIIRKFIKPNHADILEYLLEKQQQMDVDYFIDYYESKDWMIGKNRMKNWKSAVNNWIRNDKKYEANNAKPKQQSYADRTNAKVRELLARSKNCA